MARLIKRIPKDGSSPVRVLACEDTLNKMGFLTSPQVKRKQSLRKKLKDEELPKPKENTSIYLNM